MRKHGCREFAPKTQMNEPLTHPVIWATDARGGGSALLPVPSAGRLPLVAGTNGVLSPEPPPPALPTADSLLLILPVSS